MRIESRTLLLFVSCALVPVAAFSLLGYFAVTSELRRTAQAQLGAASKSYGLALYDRMQQVDQQATVLAQRYLRGEITAATVQAFSDERAHISVAEEVHDAAGATPRVQRTLHLAARPDENIAIRILAEEGQRSATLLVELSPDFLWNSEAALTTESFVCVEADGRVLHCTARPWSSEPLAAKTPGMQASATTRQDGQISVLQGSWSLYLAAAYRSSPWTITISQPTSVAFASLSAFRWMLPASATLAVVVALLFGSILIRRSHAPLRALTKAARQIARRRFDKPLRVARRDEYGRLSLAFNRMAGSLRNQFALLSAFAKLDRAILAHLGTQAAVLELLQPLPRILKCRAVGIVLFARDSDEASICFTGPDHELVNMTLERSLIGRASMQLTETSRIQRGDFGSCQALDVFARPQVRAVLVTPIVVQGELRGFVIVSDDRGSDDAFSRELSGIAHRLAVAIGNDDREATLLRQAFHDSLTGLGNRAQLRQDLAAALETSRQRGTGGALLFVDLDRFKAVNDSLGHSTGDRLLCVIAQRLANANRPDAKLARLGGDEFMIVAPDVTRGQAEALANRILLALRQPCELQGVGYVAQASIGVAMYPLDGRDVDTLLKNADTALYRAKASGRGRVIAFDATMAADTTERLAFESRLRAAIARGQPFVSYQPKVDREGRFIGVEALARWVGDDGVPIAPATFIPLAEETGLIVPLGELILQRVCRQMRNWLDDGVEIPHVAVNISMVQMRDPRFPSFVLQCLAQYGVPTSMLELELTESVFADDANSVAGLLQEFQNAGVRIAIDDFGTGFSSMSLLRHYPINTLKIDRAFVLDCHDSTPARALVSALIEVGHALRLQVVAEGVETEAQQAVLAQLGCDSMQGFLFAKALPPAELAEFAKTHGPDRLLTALRTG